MKNKYFTLFWIGNTHVTVTELCWYNWEKDCWRQLRAVRDRPS